MIHVGLSGHQIQRGAIFTVVRNSKSRLHAATHSDGISAKQDDCAHKRTVHQKIRLRFVSDQTNATAKEQAESQVLEYTAEKFQNKFWAYFAASVPQSLWTNAFPEGVNIL